MKRANCGSKLEQWRAMQESGCHVATSQRRDVPTSRRPHVATSPRRDVPTSLRWVNQYRSKQSKTSRRLNVVTPQRRDVATSRRCNIATLQRRDVSTRSAPHHLKHQWFRNRGIGRRTNEGTEFQSSSDTDFEEVSVICIVSHLLDIGLMFLRLNIFIFSFTML